MIYIITFSVFVCTIFVFLKNKVWVASPISNNINLKNSYLYWFNASDFSNPKYKNQKFTLLFNNTTNLIVAITFLLLLTGVVVFILGSLS
jgi:hypothetical protein